VVCTGLTEGAGLLCMASPWIIDAEPLAWLLAALLGLRYLAWECYRSGLLRDGMPQGTRMAFDGIDGGFAWGGNLAPAALALLGGVTGLPVLVALAGLIAVIAGAAFKYTLICTAAYNQGFALNHLPVRGQGPSGGAVKPGWARGG
jgi:phenylacetyl-CoA:acceptor oxidoreductase subunit 2